MKHKINESKNKNNLKEEILSRRGVENPVAYLNTSEKDIVHHSLLGSTLSEAYDCLKETVEDKVGIGILIDTDYDGMASASMLYSYLKETFDIESKYYIHSSKQHGLSDKELLPKIEADVNSGAINLLFIPDAGTNDIKETDFLVKLGCKIIVLDHHEIEKENKRAILINPQKIKNYPNLESSGTMVTWKFLKFVDDQEWVSNADKYLDLVASSIISDSMKILSHENRYFIEIGLRNIKNKFLQEMITKDFRIKETPPTITEIAFYVVPCLNGLIRSGSQEEKELVFKALCGIDEEFDYVKRDKTVIKENIYTRAVRLCTNAKSRQDRAVQKGIDIVIADIELNKRNNNKILFALADDTLDKAFTGLVAMKLASKYNKPCVLLRESKEDYFAGSIRNFNDSPLTDLKAFLQSTGYVAWMAGHANASGIGLTKKQLIKTIELTNEKLKDYDFSAIHLVDFEFDYSDLTDLNNSILMPLYELRYYYGQGISEVKLLIKNIKVNSSKIFFFAGKGEKKNNWKFELKNEIDVINFRADDEDYIYNNFGSDTLNWDGKDIELDIIVKVGRTEYNGATRWCLYLEDYEIKS